MSTIGSYKTTSFSEGQKFLVIDPATGSTSLVRGGDIVSYITPSLDSVKGVSTTDAAATEDFDVGTVVQTTGGSTPNDGNAGIYLVVGEGEGDVVMLNGNELLLIRGDAFLRDELASSDPGEGASLVSMGNGDTVEDYLQTNIAETVDSIDTLRASSFPANLERLWLKGAYGDGTPWTGEFYRSSGVADGGNKIEDADGVIWERAEPQPFALSDYPTTVASGSWSWFSRPVAYYLNGVTYVGSVDGNGSQFISSYDHATQQVTSFQLTTGSVKDDHIVPVITVLGDGRIMVFYPEAGGGPVHYRISTNPEDITAFDADQTVGSALIFPNVFRLSGESGRIYLIANEQTDARDTYFWYTDDDGATWSAGQHLVDGLASFDPANDGLGLYHVCDSNEVDRIDIAITGAEGPSDDPKVDVRHLYLAGGSAFDASGNNLGTLPVAFDNVPAIYDSSDSGNTDVWVQDVCTRSGGRVEVVFSEFDSPVRHVYWFAAWDGSSWVSGPFAEGGTFISAGDRERFYSGGIALNRAVEGELFASIGDTGSSNIQRWTTPNNGGTWSTAEHTSAFRQNVRPMSPLNADKYTPVVWVEGAYGSYNDYFTDIKIGKGPSNGSSVSLPSPGGTRVYLGSTVSGVSGGTTVPFNLTTYDIKDNADLASDGIRVSQPGLYLIQATVQLQNPSASLTEAGVDVYRNGSRLFRCSISELTSGFMASSGSDIRYLQNGDLLTVVTSIPSGETADIIGGDDIAYLVASLLF